jgi:hypothetical protein
LGIAPEELDPREEHNPAAEQATEELEGLVAAILVVVVAQEQEAVAIVAEVADTAADTTAVEGGTEADQEDKFRTLVVERFERMSALLEGTELLEDIGIPLEAGLRHSIGVAGAADDRIDSYRRGFLRVDSTVTLLNCFEQCYSFRSFELDSDIASFEARLGREKCKVGW